MADRTRRDDADPDANDQTPPASMAAMAGENFGEGVQIEMPMTDTRVREIVAEMLAAQKPAPAPEARSPLIQWKHDADHGETEASVKEQHVRDLEGGVAYIPPVA